MGAVHGIQNNHDSNIKEHWAQITIADIMIKYYEWIKCNEKVWNIVRVTKMWHRHIKWAHAYWKMAPRDLMDTGLL